MKKLPLTLVFAISLFFSGCGDSGDLKTIPVENLTLNKSALTLVKGQKIMLTASVIPSGADQPTIIWKSDAQDIVRVDRISGHTEAISEGEAIITAIAGESGKTASCRIVVTSTLNILFIGNSFTEDAVQHLPGIVSAAGLENVNMVHMNYGGRIIEEYASGYSTVDDYRCSRCAPGHSSWTVDNTPYTLQQVVRERHWNVVTIQEHTGRTVAWNWTNDYRILIEQWLSNMRADQTGSPAFNYIMSQAYGDTNKVSYGNSSWETSIFEDQDKMYRTIVAQARRIFEQTSVDGLIATGTLLQNLRSSSLNTPYDLTRDGYHMDLGLARYGAACTVFESIIVPRLEDATLEVNSFRFAAASTEHTKYSTPVTDENARIAISAARCAVAAPFEVTSFAEQ